jgi:hypothetical protein
MSDDEFQTFKQALKDFSESSDPEQDKITSASSDLDFFNLSGITSIGALTTQQITALDLSSLCDANTISLTSLSPNAYATGSTINLGGGGGAGAIYTTGAIPGGWNNSGKVKIDAEDIEVNGKSLMKCLDRIEQQLGILDTDDTLENEWQELRTLGEQYRALQQKIKDKQKTFDILKTLPEPTLPK